MHTKMYAMTLASFCVLVSYSVKYGDCAQAPGVTETSKIFRQASVSEVELPSGDDGHGLDFKSTFATTIKSPVRNRGPAQRDARTLAHLAGLGNDITNQQLAHINQLLATHHDDPYFAEQAVTTLGAKGTLTFWQIADRSNNSNNREKILTKLQKNLSHTLAIATHSNSPKMAHWKKGIIRLGPHQFPGNDPDNPRRGYGPYGFQTMSSLMRNGNFDPKFLRDYGKKLISFEQHHAHGDTQKLWMPESMQASLNYTGTDKGNDPMAGYLEALGHTPQAAKKLFYSHAWGAANHPIKDEKHLNSELRHLLRRDWFMDPASASTAGTSSGTEELGHALEAATLGRPSNKPRSGIQRDNTTATIMEQVVALTAKHSKLLADLPQLHTSLAKMGAGYIDGLDWALSSSTGADSSALYVVFQHQRTKHFNPTNSESESFLNVVGTSEAGHSILSAAQRYYSVNRLSEDWDSDVSPLLNTSAAAHAQLDQARLNGIERGHHKDTADEELTTAAAWTHYSASKGRASNADLLTLSTKKSTVEFAVPKSTENTAGKDNTFNKKLERRLERKQPTENRSSPSAKKDFLDSARSQALAPTAAYVNVLEASGSRPPLRNLFNNAYTAYVFEFDLAHSDAAE